MVPRRVVSEKSAAARMRCAAGSMPAQAERRSRPLERRAARMERPARVRIRARKPWVFARRRVLGWNVRFMVWLLDACVRGSRLLLRTRTSEAGRPSLRNAPRAGQTGPAVDRHLWGPVPLTIVTTPVPHLWIIVWTAC